MLLYEYRIREQFERARSHAESLRAKFVAQAPTDELLRDCQVLTSVCEHLDRALPGQIGNRGNLWRHLGFMNRNLADGAPDISRTDIEDLCERDLPALEERWRRWCASRSHYDQELEEKTSQLLMDRQWDSAIRKAFVILKERMVGRFGLSSSTDGSDLVNTLFGKQGKLSGAVGDTERQGMRDLLCGLYSIFRHTYAHRDREAPWHETEAVLSMVNFVLKRIDEYPETPGP